MSIPLLNPSNDLSFSAKLQVVNLATGLKENVTTGTVAAFLALSNSPTATFADASLVGTCTYTGSNGIWTVGFLGSVLTPSLLNTLFAAVTPYCIVTLNATSIRVYFELDYAASRAAVVG